MYTPAHAYGLAFASLLCSCGAEVNERGRESTLRQVEAYTTPTVPVYTSSSERDAPSACLYGSVRHAEGFVTDLANAKVTLSYLDVNLEGKTDEHGNFTFCPFEPLTSARSSHWTPRTSTPTTVQAHVVKLHVVVTKPGFFPETRDYVCHRNKSLNKIIELNAASR